MPAALTLAITACDTALASIPVFSTSAFICVAIALALALASVLIDFEPKNPLRVRLSSRPLRQ